MIAPGGKKKTNPGKLALFSSVPARANPLLHPSSGIMLNCPMPTPGGQGAIFFYRIIFLSQLLPIL
jgi:hypothetical protein